MKFSTARTPRQYEVPSGTNLPTEQTSKPVEVITVTLGVSLMTITQQQ
jgi:hypothetical protein